MKHGFNSNLVLTLVFILRAVICSHNVPLVQKLNYLNVQDQDLKHSAFYSSLCIVNGLILDLEHLK